MKTLLRILAWAAAAAARWVAMPSAMPREMLITARKAAERPTATGGSSLHFLRALRFCTGVKKGSRELDSSATHWPRDIVILSDASHGRGLQ